MTDRREETAIHEAGHAVIARILGISSGEVTIEPTSDFSLGHAVFVDPRFSWQRGDGSKAKAANAFVTALFARAEAERLILGSEGDGDSEDCDRAVACLAWAGAVRGATFVGDDYFDQHQNSLRKKVAKLVKSNQSLIEKVAAALLERKKLTAVEVDEIFTKQL